MKSRLLSLLIWLFAISPASGQFKFYDDAFNGGVVSGGYSIGTSNSGTGSFTVNIPPGSTIRKGYFLAGRLGNAAASTVTLNGTPYNFNATNEITGGFTSLYGSPSAVHIIDVTAGLSAATTNYTVTVPAQSGGKFVEFYLVITFDNPAMSQTVCCIYLQNANMASPLNYVLNTSLPVSTASDVGLSAVGGYMNQTASNPGDCETVIVNGTTLGTMAGKDFNAATNYGAMGAMQYYNGSLAGYGDDIPDQAINGPDVLSNIAAVIPNNTTAIPLTYEHCPPSVTSADNHIWITLLAYSTAVVLPEQDMGLNGTCDLKGEVSLSWSGIPEINGDRYLIESSKDGMMFSEIGSVDGKGMREYQLNDVPGEAGWITYRVTLLDGMGAYRASDEVLVWVEEGGDRVEIYPNPFSESLTLSYQSNMHGSIQIYLADITGRLVYSDRFEVTRGRVKMEIDPALAPGVYFLEIRDERSGLIDRRKVVRK